MSPESTPPDAPKGKDWQIPALLRRYPPRLVWAAFALINGFVTIGLLAMVAALTGTSFVFPSLGPTAYLLFSSPTQPGSSPRNAICGHLIGILCGYGSLLLFGLAHHPPTIVEGVDAQRVLCAATSLATTGAGMILLGVSHPPAGATTLIISLGIITGPYQLVVIELAVAILVLQALIINRAAGIDYPIWGPKPGAP
jgi:CBS domain-containing membrane protein